MINYNTEIFKRDMARGVASAVDSGDPEPVLAAGGAAFAEIPVPPSFADRTIKELDIRRACGSGRAVSDCRTLASIQSWPRRSWCPPFRAS